MMLLPAFIPVCCLLLIPPLSAEESAMLESASLHRDHRETAFVAMLSHVSRWDGTLGDAAVRLEADPERLNERAELERGELFRLVGRVEQIERLHPPYETVDAVFLIDREDRPLLVYLHRQESTELLARRDEIEIVARYYKPIRRVARDGVERSYASFVSAISMVQTLGERRAAGSPDWMPQVVMVVLIALLFPAFLLVRARLRRQREVEPRRGGPVASLDDGDSSLNLPADPAEALRVLKTMSERR